jgi:gluconate transporter
MLLLLGSLIFLIILIAWFKFHAFPALILTAVLTGLCAGMDPLALLKSIQQGVGDTLGGLALVIGFGMLLGSLLADTGATGVISQKLLQFFGVERATWALAFTGSLIGLAMFYNAGFVILAPLAFSIARQTGQPLVPLAIAMAAPLSVTHCFLPPHPGATAVANILEADLGKTLLLGLFVSAPAILIAGLLLPSFLKKIPSAPPKGIFPEVQTDGKAQPPFIICLLAAILPVVLMASATISQMTLPVGHSLRTFLTFVGDSNMAMLISVLLALLFLVALQGQKIGPALDKSAGSLGAIAGIMLILGAGGAFKQVLLDTGIGKNIADQLTTLPLSPLVLGWLIATIMRIAVGSATVAGMTAAGIAQPLLQGTAVSPELMALAIGAGSVMCSHVNDTGFWMFREWFGLSLRDTFRTWTLMETIVGVVGLLGVLVLNMLI